MSVTAMKKIYVLCNKPLTRSSQLPTVEQIGLALPPVRVFGVSQSVSVSPPQPDRADESLCVVVLIMSFTFVVGENAEGSFNM